MASFIEHRLSYGLVKRSVFDMNLLSKEWADVQIALNDDGTNTWVTVVRPIDSRFYRLTKAL